MKKLLLTGLLVFCSVSSYARTCTILLDSSVTVPAMYQSNLFPDLRNAKLTRDVSAKTDLGIKVITLGADDVDSGERNVFGDPILKPQKKEYNVQLFKDGSIVTETGYETHLEIALTVMEILIGRLPYGCK